ncbi:ephexin-1-like [Ruditapes philippinarum]|uniref:ephexin-1-like n=1 Tax=Ruditapes philippinarum TaxID=129788 RepID=UPI00295B915E|nr:ephexin-1-like [Ruditapes philippinarum]
MGEPDYTSKDSATDSGDMPEATIAKTSDEVKYTTALEAEHLYQYYDKEIQNQHLKRGLGDPENSDDETEDIYDECDLHYEPNTCFKNWIDKTEVKISDAVENFIKEEKEKKGKKEEKIMLQEMKFEMITSEASYLQSINTFIDVFMKSELFRRMESGNDESKRDFQNIFSNIASIQETSENLLKELESHWKKDILIPNVCKIVANHVEQHFECYVEYCGNEHRQIKRLECLRKTQNDFNTDLTQLEKSKACQEMDITSFIKLPMKRITRICILTQIIYHQSCKIYGNESEPKKHANSARKAAAKISKRCNTTAAVEQGKDNMVRAASEIEFSNKDEADFEIKKDKRYLVWDSDVSRVMTEKDETIKSEELRLYFFNDKAVFTKKKERPPYTVVEHCPLLALKYENVDEKYIGKFKQFLPEKDPERFLLHLVILNDHKSERSELMLLCKRKRDRKELMKLIVPMKESIYTVYDCPVVKCIKAYTAKNDDELSLQISDEVKVKVKEKDNWFGERIKDFEEGWFPKSHVEENSDDEHIEMKHRLQRYLLMRNNAT